MDLVAEVRALDRRIDEMDKRIAEAVGASRTTLVTLFGIGPVLAAKILGHTGDVRRFPTKDHYASYTATAPIEASSGDIVRHRLSRAGNRQLTHALYIAAFARLGNRRLARPTTGASWQRARAKEKRSGV